MSLKSMALKLGLAFAAVKGVQTVRNSGGVEGLKRRLSDAQSGKGDPNDPIAGAMRKLGLSGSGGAGTGGGISGLLGGLAAASGGAASGTKIEGLLARTRMGDAVPDDEAEAGLIIRAMVMAAKADGNIDTEERRILDKMIEENDDTDRAFLETALEAPVDPQALASQVPAGQERDIYTASVMAIEPNNRAEAEHLHALAQALKMSEEDVNAIHTSLGKTPLY
ncbi:DUF533 domain-containing protein [Tranquillimonas rosea]|uniref:DUF533 domain-containing protein n=1 Tax=Tranquillimonas rosea TaxID=641238 RepID=UPI003BAAC5D9